MVWRSRFLSAVNLPTRADLTAPHCTAPTCRQRFTNHAKSFPLSSSSSLILHLSHSNRLKHPARVPCRTIQHTASAPSHNHASSASAGPELRLFLPFFFLLSLDLDTRRPFGQGKRRQSPRQESEARVRGKPSTWVRDLVPSPLSSSNYPDSPGHRQTNTSPRLPIAAPSALSSRKDHGSLVSQTPWPRETKSR